MIFIWLLCGLVENESSLAERVRRLEQQMGSKLVTEAQLTLYQQQCEARLAKERNGLDKQWNVMDKAWKDTVSRLDDLERKRSGIIWLLGVVGVVSLSGIAGWIFLLKKKLEQEFEKRFKAKADALRKVLAEYETDAQVRKEERIMVLGARDGAVPRLLDDLKFRHVLAEPVPLGEPRSPFFASLPKEIDLVVFDQLDAAWINGFLEVHPDHACLAYHTGAGRLNVPQEKVSFANSPMTLYARLMEVARFRRLAQSA